MKWEVVIGLETHVQLTTRSKLLSGSATDFGARPNTQASGIDLALPGTLPALNRAAVEKAIRFALAVGGEVSPRSLFARKHYFYPDLPKGYQISQYELPIVRGGTIRIPTSEGQRAVRLTRAHLEEDAGKSLHEDFHGMTGIDLNRAGTPLLEIVSEPDMRSSAEAVTYAKTLHALVRWIEICDGNMQEGSFRCDANVSVRPAGEAKLGTRCEIKNLNSFRFLERAIDFEARRQINVLEDGGRVTQETRLYDPDHDETRAMRSKEDAMDYRYFPDPDLLPLAVDRAWIDRVAQTLPELPQAKRERYEREYSLSLYDTAVLTSSRELAAYFEQVVQALPNQKKLAANWVMVELCGRLNRENLDISQSPVSSLALSNLLKHIGDGVLSNKLAKETFDAMWAGEGSADQIIEAKGLRQISDPGTLEDIAREVVGSHPAQVTEFRAGKEKAFNFLIGQAMKTSKGKADPAQLSAILRRELEKL